VSKTDTYTVTVVEAPDFGISVSPRSGYAIRGSYTQMATGTVTVSLVPLRSPETVSLSALGVPSGASCGFVPSSGTPSFSSSMTIFADPSTPPGTYTITIVGRGGGITRACTYTLTVM
jgi:hypothetical protein